MSSDGGWKRSGSRGSGINLAIEQLEAQIEAEVQAEKRGACVLRRRKGAGKIML
jgi:hypothetical protein